MGKFLLEWASMVFVMRKLDRGPATLGEKLRALRRGQAITLDIMERETHVQRRYLEALEHGRYEALPEPLYTRNFIRAYARVLNADANYFIELYEEECGRCDLVGPLRMPRQKVRRFKLFAWNRLMKFGSVALAGLAIVGYLSFQLISMVAAPEVIVFTPSADGVAREPQLLVTGQVEEEASVYINGEQVVVNPDHTFSVEVDLEKGLNTIVIEAERRYSRRASISRQVVFDPSESGQVSLRLQK